jgi:hypothetical protein
VKPAVIKDVLGARAASSSAPWFEMVSDGSFSNSSLNSVLFLNPVVAGDGDMSAKRGDSFSRFGWAECSVWMAVVVNEAGEVVVVGFTWILKSRKTRGGQGTAMQMLLWPAAPHTRLSCSLPSSMPLSTHFLTPSEYPIQWPSCNP